MRLFLPLVHLFILTSTLQKYFETLQGSYLLIYFSFLFFLVVYLINNLKVEMSCTIRYIFLEVVIQVVVFLRKDNSV